MSSYVTLTLDTTPPTGQSISAAASTANRVNVPVTLVCAEANATYQMKIYGDLDGSDANFKPTEGASTWITFSGSATVTLSVGDGAKTLRFKVRDDVYNESTEVTTSITLASTTPTVTISTAISTPKVSKISPKDVATFAFTADVAFIEYKVKVVPTTGSLENAGTAIGTYNDADHTGGTGSFNAATPIVVTIRGTAFQTAGATEMSASTIKVFVKNVANVWSIA